jgi:hypothetical protein
MSDTDRSTPDLIASAIDDTLTLVRHEIELAKLGIIENVIDRLKGIGLATVAGLLLLPGLMFLAIALALALPFSPQTGFFLVGLVLFVTAGLGVWIGIRLIRKGGKDSKQALDAVKEDVRWARGLIKR